MIPHAIRKALRMGRANKIRFGVGSRTRVTPFGTTVSFDSEPADFSHPWQTSLAGDRSVSIRPGTINRVAAKIKGVPLAGDKDNPPPVLRWSPLQLDAERRGFICAEVTLDPAKFFEVKSVEMVQVADPDTDDGAAGREPNRQGGARPLSGFRARHPVAMLREREGDARLDVYQIAFFDVQHRVQQRAGTGFILRHFFW
jgi:hypothetical protein